MTNKEERLIKLFKNLSEHAYDMVLVDPANKDSYIKESIAYDAIVNCMQSEEFLQKMEKLFN